MKYRTIFILLLTLSVAIVNSAAVDDDMEGSAHMENPDDEDFEDTSGVPQDKVQKEKAVDNEKVNPPQSDVAKPTPAVPPTVFIPENVEKAGTSGFSPDATTIAILIGTIVLVVLIIIAVVICCRKKSNREYTRGNPSNKAYV